MSTNWVALNKRNLFSHRPAVQKSKGKGHASCKGSEECSILGFSSFCWLWACLGMGCVTPIAHLRLHVAQFPLGLFSPLCLLQRHLSLGLRPIQIVSVISPQDP